MDLRHSDVICLCVIDGGKNIQTFTKEQQLSVGQDVARIRALRLTTGSVCISRLNRIAFYLLSFKQQIPPRDTSNTYLFLRELQVESPVLKKKKIIIIVCMICGTVNETCNIGLS